MKKFRNTLGIMALATVAMFSAQTAKAQCVLDQEDDEPVLKGYTTITNDAKDKRTTSDFVALFNTLNSPEYHNLVFNLARRDNLTEDEVYKECKKAGIEEMTSACISWTWKVKPDVFKKIACYLVNPYKPY